MSVHSIDVLSSDVGAGGPPLRATGIQGVSGTLGSFILRILQLLLSAGAVCLIVTSTNFNSVTAFRYLVGVAVLQVLWSLATGLLDIYSLSVSRGLQALIGLFATIDLLISLAVLSAASASSSIPVVLNNDFRYFSKNPCLRYMIVTVMCFFCFLVSHLSFWLNFWAWSSEHDRHAQ